MPNKQDQEKFKKLLANFNPDNIPVFSNEKVNKRKEFQQKYLKQPNLEAMTVFNGEYSNDIKGYRDFSGGLNTDNISDALSEKELLVAENIDYSRRGNLSKRPDVSNYNSTSYNMQVERVFEWIKENGQSELMAVMADEYMYKIDGPDSKTQLFKLENTYIDNEVLKNYMYFLDGNNYYRIDDETFTVEPVPEKDTSEKQEADEVFDAELGAGHSLEDDFSIAENSETVYKNQDMETEYTKNTDYSMDYANGNITPLSDGDMKDGEAYYIEYEYIEPSDNDLSSIKNCKYITRHEKSYRFFCAGNPNDPKALYYSEYNDPQYFKDISVLYPTTNDGPIQGLSTINDMLVVFFKHSIWVWRGIDPERDAVWEKMPVKHGTKNHRTIELAYNSLTFVDNNGIYTLNTNKGLKNIARDKVINEIKEIENYDYNTTIFDPYNDRYLLAYSDLNGKNDKILALDWALGSYSVWTGIQVNDFCYTQDGKLFIASQDYIKQLNKTASETSNSINYHLKTKELNLGNPHYKKVIKKIMLDFDNLDSSAEITVNLIVDGNTVKTFNITAEDTINRVLEKGSKVQLEIINNQSGVDINFFGFAVEYMIANTYDNEL